MARPATWLAALTLAAIGCSHRPVAEFEPYPEAEVAGARSPHAFRGAPLCQACHVRGDGLREDPVSLCHRCHAFHGQSHPTGVVQKGAAGGLPLWEGKVACHSCHDPHDVKGRKAGLRRAADDLCVACHHR